MSNGDMYQHLREAPTKMKLLRLLWWFTANSEYPTAKKLAEQVDGRENIPRATIHTRRKMVRELRDAGYAEVIPMGDNEFTHYAISPAGIELIKAMDLEAQL